MDAAFAPLVGRMGGGIGQVFPDLDFDFVGYPRLRLAGYRLHKESFIFNDG